MERKERGIPAACMSSREEIQFGDGKYGDVKY